MKDRKDLLIIKYKRALNGKIQIMSKDDMRKIYGKSPDKPDALALTFYNTNKREVKSKPNSLASDPSLHTSMNNKIFTRNISQNASNADRV